MDPNDPAYNIDWVFSNNSNVHVANNRGWFKTFTPFQSSVGPAVPLRPVTMMDVEGVGDIELTVKTHPNRNGRNAQGALLLRDVLYAPSAVCNILGMPIIADCNLLFGGEAPNKLRDRQTDHVVALLDSPRLWRLRLRGQSSKQTSLDPERQYVIGANWPESQRTLWEEFKQSNKGKHALESGDMPKPKRAKTNKQELQLKPTLGIKATFKDSDSAMVATEPGLPPLTPAEKAWLKANYRNEYHFLLTYGLHIHKDEDRAEGRSILKALVAKDEPESDSNDGWPPITDDEDDEEEDEEDEDEDNSSSSTNSLLQEMEDDPASHVADRWFDDEELDWIKKFHGHSGNFMLSNGLKPWSDMDCDLAQSTIKGLMVMGRRPH